MKNTLLRHMRHLLLIGMSTLSLAVGLAGLTVQPAHAASRVPSDDTCYGASCYGKDPVTFGCLASYTISPDNKPEYYNNQLVGYFSSVYSYTCNVNWNQATLTDYALSQRFRLKTIISAKINPELHCDSELVIFPANGTSYGGETGVWPTYSDMVDGTCTTYSIFALFDKNGNILMDDVDVSQ